MLAGNDYKRLLKIRSAGGELLLFVERLFICFLIPLFSLYASYKDLRGLPDLLDKTLLVIKAPPDTIMECDNEEEVRYFL